MAPRRNVDRAAWETRSHRESMSRRVDSFERYDDGMDARFERYSDRGVDRYERGYDRYDRGVSSHGLSVEWVVPKRWFIKFFQQRVGF